MAKLRWFEVLLAGTVVAACAPQLNAIDLRPAPNESPVSRIVAMSQPSIPLDGKPVYVLSNGQWLEATLLGWSWRSNTGERYQVRYAQGNRTESGVGRDRIRTLAEAQNAGVSTNVYDLSSQAGRDRMLSAHNQWRAKVNVAPLRWSPQLAAYAQQWADKLLAENKFEHRPDGRYGENLASAGGQQLSPDRVVEMWGNEVRDYNYATNSCAPGKVCGHYTQVVWRNTTEVGCGMARDRDKEIWVCNYNPPGNFVGQKPY